MKKKTIEIRARLSVEVGSEEEMLWNYLMDKGATPHSFHKMLTLAVETFWLPLAYQYNKQPASVVSEILVDVAYRWQLHDFYLHKKTGMTRSRVNFNEPFEANESVVVAADNKEDNIKHAQAPTTKPEAQTTTQTDLVDLPVEQASTDLLQEVGVQAKPFNPFGSSIISQ